MALGLFAVAALIPPPSLACGDDASAQTAAVAGPSNTAPIQLAVEGDTPIEVVAGPTDSDRVVIYLHGVCGDVHAFGSWVGAATRHATFIAMRGDLPCEQRRGRYKWSYNYAHLNRRILKAIRAANALRPKPLDDTDVALIGYSQGARRAELMAAHFPQRYRRVAIIAIVSEPSPDLLSKAHSILLMAGSRDARQHIKDGAEKLRRSGKRVQYMELPGARHGEYGPDAPRVMRIALDWLFAEVT